MDMLAPYIAATLAALPEAAVKFAFERFHCAMHFDTEVDKVRRQENRPLCEQGDETLKGTRHLWLFHPDRLQKIFDAWYSWAIRSRVELIERVARMIKCHLQGVLNAIVSRLTNTRLKGLNTIIQGLKCAARGFRNRERFRNAIYFGLLH